jgi:hypothetical protein
MIWPSGLCRADCLAGALLQYLACLRLASVITKERIGTSS